MSVKRKTEDTRGMALWYITEYLERHLSFPSNLFLGWLAGENLEERKNGEKVENKKRKKRKSIKTLQRYIKGETAMKSWKFEEFWKMVEKAVHDYLRDNPEITAIWEQEKAEQKEKCRNFFVDLNAPERSGSFQEYAENRQELLKRIEPIFEALDKRIAYSLQANFPALASVTAEDCVFIAHVMTRTEEEKEALKVAMLQGATVDAGTMLAYLQSEEVRCWVDLEKHDYSNTARNSKAIWERFSEKLMALTPWQYANVTLLIETILLLALDKGDPEAKGIEVKLPTADDIELLLLFKYCLDPDERGQYIESE